MKKNGLNKSVTKKEFVIATKGVKSRFDKLDDVITEFKIYVDNRFDKLDDVIAEFKIYVDNRFDKLDDVIAEFKIYVDNRFDEFGKIVYTKADHEVFMVWMDEAMKELRSTREGRVLTEEQMLRLDDKVANHESRICALEKK